ncbi:MAG: hypothetical protein GY700_04490, partial [Propionibacteriaceae bacterium]|nr:hypothetical protein [Propionibacteriaceae bacterium]
YAATKLSGRLGAVGAQRGARLAGKAFESVETTLPMVVRQPVRHVLDWMAQTPFAREIRKIGLEELRTIPRATIQAVADGTYGLDKLPESVQKIAKELERQGIAPAYIPHAIKEIWEGAAPGMRKGTPGYISVADEAAYHGDKAAGRARPRGASASEEGARAGVQFGEIETTVGGAARRSGISAEKVGDTVRFQEVGEQVAQRERELTSIRHEINAMELRAASKPSKKVLKKLKKQLKKARGKRTWLQAEVNRLRDQYLRPLTEHVSNLSEGTLRSHLTEMRYRWGELARKARKDPTLSGQ